LALRRPVAGVHGATWSAHHDHVLAGFSKSLDVEIVDRPEWRVGRTDEPDLPTRQDTAAHRAEHLGQVANSVLLARHQGRLIEDRPRKPGADQRAAIFPHGGYAHADRSPRWVE